MLFYKSHARDMMSHVSIQEMRCSLTVPKKHESSKDTPLGQKVFDDR